MHTITTRIGILVCIIGATTIVACGRSVSTSSDGSETLSDGDNATSDDDSTTSDDDSGGDVDNGIAPPTDVTMTEQTADSISLSWTASTSIIDHYQIYRDGSKYATTGDTTYKDAAATKATNVNYDGPYNVYVYAVSSVDSDGHESALATQVTYWAYRNGVTSWDQDWSYSLTADYEDTDGESQVGPYDIKLTVTGPYGGFQPYANHTTPLYDLSAGAFSYISFDLKPTRNDQSWVFCVFQRIVYTSENNGDIGPWKTVDVGSYGPSPKSGVWATYKIPLADVTIGTSTFTGSISDNTLTITSFDSGPGIDGGGFLTGDGIAPGTFVASYDQTGGKVGTYTIATVPESTQNVGSTAMTLQRSSIYKFQIHDGTGVSSNTFYMDNIKFTAE